MDQVNLHSPDRVDNQPPINRLGIPSRETSQTLINAKSDWRLYRLALVVSDLFLTFAAFIIAYWVRFIIALPLFAGDTFLSKDFYNHVMLTVIPIWLAIFALTGLYSKSKLLGGTQEYASLFNATTLGMFVLISARFTFPTSLVVARGWVIIAWALTFLLTALGRFMLRRIVYSLRAQGRFRSRALIVGTNEEGRLLADQFLATQTSGFQIIGFIEAGECGNPAHGMGSLSCLGDLTDLDDIVRQHTISQIILTSSALNQDQILALYKKYGTSPNVDLLLSSGLYEIITTGLKVREDGSVPLVVINKVRLTGVDQALKLIMDYAITLPAMLLLSPIFLLIGLLVRLDSPGPIIYRRRVMGMNGSEFDAFKFRTMDVRSDDILKTNPELMREYLQNFKIKDDPRITRVGKWLRKTSLDELPQLINVLRGEMSLIGPRMITPQELDKYSQWGMNLTTVKPGITGLWQVRGRSDVSYEERVRMDMYYIRNWTIWIDLQLLLQTIPAVLTKRGAY
jgi:exopolysaccharide biosynthesis polyprenyl glycosylphosphotransferase